jgi:hypothetical protein
MDKVLVYRLINFNSGDGTGDRFRHLELNPRRIVSITPVNPMLWDISSSPDAFRRIRIAIAG